MILVAACPGGNISNLLFADQPDSVLFNWMDLFYHYHVSIGAFSFDSICKIQAISQKGSLLLNR